MIQELTLVQAKQSPACFLYAYAPDTFLKAIPRKYGEIIAVKRAHERKLMALSAEKERMTLDAFAAEVKNAFVEMYEHTPAEALLILAQGGTIAGKDWSKGVYGIGATLVSTFAGQDGVTVRAEDGHILKNGVDITDITKTIYSPINGNVIPFQYFGVDDGVTYQSQYNKKDGKYYAQTFSNASGLFKAYNGSATSGSDAADIWGTITMWVEKVLNWILSFFGTSIEAETGKVMTPENTLPNQNADGFIQESGMSDAVKILLLAAAGGSLIASGALKGKKTKTVK